VLLGQTPFGISHAWLAIKSDNLFDLKRRYMLRRKVLHQELPFGGWSNPFSSKDWRCRTERLFFSAKTSIAGLSASFPPKPRVAGWSHRSTQPQLRWDPPLLPYDALASVPSPPQSRQTLHLLRLMVSWGSLRPHSPASLGPHPPADLPASSLVHWAHSHTPRFLRGFSDLPHSLLGVRPRLSPHPGHDDWNPGQLGLQFSCVQDACQI